MKNLSILCASLMAGEGIVNGFTEKCKEVFTGGYWSINPGHPDFNGELVRMVLDKRPDIVWIQTQNANALYPHTAKEIARFSFVMQWSGDIRYTTEAFYKEIGREIQLTTFSNQRDVDNCLAENISADFLQIGFNPEIYRPLNIPKIKEDSILMMFNNYDGSFELSNYREEIAMNLIKEFPNEAALYGNGWSMARGNVNGSQDAENHKYNEGKIGINISHFIAPLYSSDRLFRMLGSGIMIISHRYPRMEEDFEIGKHLVVYDTTEELIQKVRYYLDHDEERESIGKAGCELANYKFTFLNMVENIKNLYLKHKK